MSIHLTTIFGSPLDVEFAADDLPLLIGRGNEADLPLKDHWVSRQHCLLTLKGDRVYVRDLKSKHGTYVNRNRVDRAELHSGDCLDIGLTTFLLEKVPAGSPAGECL